MIPSSIKKGRIYWLFNADGEAVNYQAFKLCVASAAQVSALHALGPDYQSTFSTLETDAALDQVPAAAVLVTEGKDSLEARLLLSYNAQVLLMAPLCRLRILQKTDKKVCQSLQGDAC